MTVHKTDRAPTFRLGRENEGASFYVLTGHLMSGKEHIDDHDVTRFRNVYKGSELVGSIMYDASRSRDDILVWSIYVRPKYRGDMRPLQALIRPLLRDGRPIDTIDGHILDKKLHYLALRAFKSGRVRMGSNWTATQKMHGTIS